MPTPSRCSSLRLLAILALFAGLLLIGESQAQQKKAKQQEKAAKEATNVVKQEMKGKEAELLKKAYIFMAMANHDYDGHRGKAMGNVESAVKLLDHSIMKKGTGNQKVLALEEEITSARAKFLAKHEGTVHEPQAISDMQMREAYVLIRDMTPGLAELKQPRVEEHVKKALEHITIALKIR
jgi:hypothetical protein